MKVGPSLGMTQFLITLSTRPNVHVLSRGNQTRTMVEDLSLPGDCLFLPSILDVDTGSDTGKTQALVTWTWGAGAVWGSPWTPSCTLARPWGGENRPAKEPGRGHGGKTWRYGDWKPGNRCKEGKQNQRRWKHGKTGGGGRGGR